MDYRHDDQQRRQQLLTIVDRGNAEQLFTFLQAFHRRPFRNLAEVIAYDGVIDDQIDFIDCTGTRYNVTPLIIAAGKGSFEKTKILLVHGANPNKQCSTGDTALNLAVHRQKYHIVDLLLKYRANPNVYNQSGKTALHRAVASYIDENANHIRTLLHAGADPTIEDRNQRIPLDEAVIANKPDIVGVLLSHDRTLTQRAYRAAIIAARLGHDKCLETLLDYGMDPNIMDRTRTTALHVAVRSLKLSTARLLVSHGADLNLANNRGETAIGIAEYLPTDQKQSFINVLVHTPRIGPSDFRTYTTGTSQANVIPYVHPLLRSHPNWTLDSDEFRTRTDINSSVQNLLDPSTGTYWCCTQNKDAWVIFDLKHQYNISGMRIIGCDNQSTPKNGHIDVSNAFNGPWLKVKDFNCPLSQGNKNDIFFAPLKTRFIRVFILDNYGGNDIRIQGIGFYGVEMRLVNLLREYGLEKSLQTLLANGINDLETLDEKQDEILNSSDKYLHVNDHFQFIRLTESLRTNKLTFLEWFNPPQANVIAGEKLQTFSAAGDEGITDRVKLEEKLENNPQIRTVLLRDLEPIQGRSLVDFPDYIIKDPGRYKVRIVSVESPDIQTPWQDIVVTVAILNLMSQSIIRRNNRTKSTDDEVDDDKVKYLTPRKYRTTQRTQLPYINNEIELNKNEYTLTPSKYRLKKFHEENTKLLYNKYPIIIGDFTLTKPPTEDNSIYNYKPKHTQTSYVYQGIVNGTEVQERAINEIKQYAQSSSPIQKKIPFMNNKNHYQSMLNLPSNNYRSATDDDLIRYHSRDSIYESIPRRNHSMTSLYPLNSSNKPIEKYDPYYFGEQSAYISSDIEEEEEEEEDSSTADEKFIIFGRDSQPQSIIQYSTFIPPPPPPHIITNHIDIIFQEVADVGTSTDDILSDTATDDRRDQSLNQQQSLVTNQSSRSEMETYRVSKHIIDRDNYEEPDAVPFPTVKYPPSISTSSPSTIRLKKNPIQSNNYEMNSMDVDQSSKTKTNQQDNYYGGDIDDEQEEEEEEEEESRRSPPTPELIRRLPRQNPIVDLPIPKYENIPINREPEQNLTQISNKSDKSRRSPKPQIVPPPDPIPRPPSSTSTTDIGEVINGGVSFRPSRQFHRTPAPFIKSPRDDDDDSEQMHRTGGQTPPPKIDSHKTKLISEGTQSEDKPTRNVGTMHEAVQTRNFGNEVQPQSSSTQTLFSSKQKPPKSFFTYIERPEPPQTIFDDSYPDKIIPSRTHVIYYDRQHPCRDTQYEDYSHHHLRSSEDYHQQPEIHRPHSRSPPPRPPPTSYHSMTRLPQDSPVTTIYRPYTPSPSRLSRRPSPHRRPHSAAPRYRPQMYSQETDTSLDAMKHQHHIGVQYEPRSTREKGTSPSIRSKKPTTSHRLIDTSIYSQEHYPTPHSSLPRRHDRSQREYYIQPTTDDYQEQEEEEDEEPSMHDQSTMAELLVSLDHYTQCESQPFMADHYVQTTPTLDEDERRNGFDLPEESDIRELPIRRSISIPQPVVIQPDTLPRTRRSQYSPPRPKRDGLDYTGKILEVSLHHGQQQRTSKRDSPLLNIGTEHIIQQSPTNEYTIPFETRYISDSIRSSTGRSRSNNSIIVPVLNSPRTHLFPNSPIRQSRSNGNFYLSSAPTRSLNSSFRLDIRTD